MKVIFVAKKALAAYFVSSADFASINIMGLPCRTNGLYSLSITFLAVASSVPITTLSGFMKSLIAKPSRKNSGFETTLNVPLAFLEMISCTLSAVPTGTVLLSTIMVYFSIMLPNCSATFKM